MITVEELISVVHRYTDPLRITVVMEDAWLNYPEAKGMHNFELVHCFRGDTQEEERLLKYYKNCPVWNLTVWGDGFFYSDKGKQLLFGIEARCYYKDIREGYLAEKADLKKARQREYRKKRKGETENE